MNPCPILLCRENLYTQEYKNGVQVVLGLSQIYVTQIMTSRDDKQYSWSDFTFCLAVRLFLAAYVLVSGR